MNEAALELMWAERACERLVYRYAWLVDSGQAAGIADLFTDDGVWAAGDSEPMRGRDGIRAGFAARQAPSDSPKFVGEYALTFRRVDGEWLIAALDLDLAFLRRRTVS